MTDTLNLLLSQGANPIAAREVVRMLHKPEPTYVWVVLQFDLLLSTDRVVEVLSSETTARIRLVGHTGDSYTIQRWEVDGDLIEQVPAE